MKIITAKMFIILAAISFLASCSAPDELTNEDALQIIREAKGYPTSVPWTLDIALCINENSLGIFRVEEKRIENEGQIKKSDTPSHQAGKKYYEYSLEEGIGIFIGSCQNSVCTVDFCEPPGSGGCSTKSGTLTFFLMELDIEIKEILTRDHIAQVTYTNNYKKLPYLNYFLSRSKDGDDCGIRYWTKEYLNKKGDTVVVNLRKWDQGWKFDRSDGIKDGNLIEVEVISNKIYDR